MFDRKKATGASESALNLVANKDDTVTRGDRAQLRQELGRRWNEAAFTKYRLDDDCSDTLRRALRREELVERFQRARCRPPVQRVWERRVIDLVCERTKVLFVRIVL